MLQEAVISSPNPRSLADVGADLGSYLDVHGCYLSVSCLISQLLAA